MKIDTAACGNKRIDNLAAVGQMRSIWDRLAYKFPMVAAHVDAIWAARKDGQIRRRIESDSKFFCLLNNPIDGPQTEAEWQLLAIAALSAIGKEPCEGELSRFDGLWVGMSASHPHLAQRHAGCAFCADGWTACPMQSYPLAHVKGRAS